MSQEIFNKIMGDCTDIFAITKADVRQQCAKESVTDAEECAAIQGLEAYHAELPGFIIEFDNGGGTTLSLGNWAHYYDDACQAAEDLIEYLRTGDTSWWDGNEPIEISYHSSSVIFDGVADIHAVDRDAGDQPHNVAVFIDAFRDLVVEPETKKSLDFKYFGFRGETYMFFGDGTVLDTDGCTTDEKFASIEDFKDRVEDLGNVEDLEWIM